MQVLFIGNSYTYYHRMPEMVSALAASSAGPQLACASVTKGGVSLEWHAHNEETLAAIRQGGWDVVVLQDHSSHPLRERNTMLKYAQILAHEIASVGAKPVLYATWAREHIPEMLEPLSISYEVCAELINAKIAPVGRAFRAVREQAPELALYEPDHSHPSAAGSYLAAAVFVALLSGACPVGLPSEVDLGDETVAVDGDDAAMLQEIAWRLCAPTQDA